MSSQFVGDTQPKLLKFSLGVEQSVGRKLQRSYLYSKLALSTTRLSRETLPRRESRIVARYIRPFKQRVLPI